MLAASLTATQTTAANAPTANNRTNNNNSNMQSKKVSLYNPTIDYSAPLQQQINPDIIGAHPHAQQYQQQCGLSSNSSGGGGGTVSTLHNTNQVRLPLQQTQQQSRLSAFTPVAATRLSLAALQPSSAVVATSTMTQSCAPAQQQQQQQQQMLATLPLKLSEQCNLSNLHLNSFVTEMSPIKIGLEQQQQNQHNNNNNINQVVVGPLSRNGDAKGLLVNNSVGSSISNLIISNNLTTNTTGAARAEAAETNNNKLNALWGQSQSTAVPYSMATAANTNANQLFGNSTNTSDAISSLWGCTSSSASIGSSSTSGCSIGSGSQPSLSPTSSTSTRPDYRGICKEPLWSALQTTPTSSSNNLRDTYYTTKSGVAINAANAPIAGGGGGALRNATDNGQQSNSPSASSTCSSTSSSASSTCSSGLGSSAGIDVGVWPNSKLQSYFAATDNCGSVAADEAAQFAKISNIWDIANPTTTRTADLFNDLWCNNASSNNNATTTATTHAIDLAEAIDFNGATSIWGTSAPLNGTARTHIKPTTMPGGNNNNNKGLRTNLTTEGENGSAGVGLATEADSGTACMQLFSEQFLNYMNIINYAD